MEDEQAEKIEIKINLKQYNFLVNRINFLENENDEAFRKYKNLKFFSDKQNEAIKKHRELKYETDKKMEEQEKFINTLEERIKMDKLEMGMMNRDYIALRKNYNEMKSAKNNGDMFFTLFEKDFPFIVKGAVKSKCIICLDEKDSIKFCNTDNCQSYFCLKCIFEMKKTKDNYEIDKCPCCRGINVMERNNKNYY